MPDQAQQKLDELHHQLVWLYRDYLRHLDDDADRYYREEIDKAVKMFANQIAIEVIGEKFVKHNAKGYEEFTHRRKHGKGWEYVTEQTAFIVNREIDEQRKRLDNLTENGE